jgi:histidyl-tRNA synthetase
MNNIVQVKRHHIGKVYRVRCGTETSCSNRPQRDQPAIARGRMREFDQADFDIIGAYDAMIADSEILRVIVEVFQALELDITIKLNHRQILDGLFAVAGVPADQTRAISSAVDKLDKASWDEVKKEMEDKGLSAEVADKIGVFVQRSGSIGEIVQYIKSDDGLLANESIKAGLADMELLARYLEAFGVTEQISFDLSLARGLDYYTGLIYEIISRPGAEPAGEAKGKKKDHSATQVGSIGAGGRYDKLIGMYGKRDVPCVGISFGVARILTILKARRQAEPRTQNYPVDVYVMAFGGGKDFDGLLLERMRVTAQLWDKGIRAEFSAKVKPKLPQQFKAAEEVPLAVILGVDELANNQVKVKALGLPSGHPEKDGVLIDRAELVTEVQKRLAALRAGDAGT